MEQSLDDVAEQNSLFVLSQITNAQSNNLCLVPSNLCLVLINSAQS